MKVLWLLLMMCGAAQAQAQEWIELTRTSNATVLVQAGATRAPSGKPAVWDYLDNARPEPNGAMSRWTNTNSRRSSGIPARPWSAAAGAQTQLSGSSMKTPREPRC